MKKKIFYLALVIIISCNSNTYDINESEKLLKQIYSNFPDSSCSVVVHPYGEYMPPLISNQELIIELKPFFKLESYSKFKRLVNRTKFISYKLNVSERQIDKSNLKVLIKEIKQRKSIDNSSKRKWLIGYSIPIFSNDGRFAFLYEYSIYGRLMGGGSCLIYEKVNGEWVLRKRFRDWIS